MKPGERLEEGIVVDHSDRGVMVGREAEPGEVLPPRHSEHYFGATRVFLSHDQAPIPPAGLHPIKPKKGKGAK